jgi:hypothetical protein
MDKPLCLIKEELEDLTGRKRSKSQIAALAYMGIKYRVRPDGTPAVLRADLSPAGQDRPSKEKKWEFRFDLLREKNF